jgi:acyl-CoA synthetase (AMP-forming)/AMP-acid ligase II
VLPAANQEASNRDGPRVGIYAEPGMQYAAATWATWMAGGVAVPLAVSHPPHELDYVIRDAGISAVSSSRGSNMSNSCLVDKLEAHLRCWCVFGMRTCCWLASLQQQ